MEEFNISEFIKYYFSKIAIVVVLFIAGIIVGWYYTEYIQVPMYKSQTSLVLTSSAGKMDVNDITVNKNLVSTYREIIKSRRILEPVIKNLKLNITYDQLNQMVRVSSVNDSDMMILITVVNEDKKEAKKIANEISKVFQDDIANIIPVDNISSLEPAIAAKKPYNINVTKQYVIAGGSGFLLGSLLVVTMFYFDDTIKKPEDIEEKIGLSVLSTVPKYKNKKKRK